MPSLDVIIRKMRLEDLEQVSIIERSTVDDPWSSNIFRDCLLLGHDCIVLVPKIEPELIWGYALLGMQHDEAHILNLAVMPQYHGNGYGLRMLQELLQIANNNKASSVILEVRDDNDVAINLYKKFKFEQIGIRKNYYRTVDGSKNALVMGLKLGG